MVSRIKCLLKRKLENWLKWVQMQNGEMKLERIELKRGENKTKKRKKKLKQMIILITGTIYGFSFQGIIPWRFEPVTKINSPSKLPYSRPFFWWLVNFSFGLKLPSICPGIGHNCHVGGGVFVSRDLFRNIKMAATEKSLEERVKARTSANQKTSAALDKNWTKR